MENSVMKDKKDVRTLEEKRKALKQALKTAELDLSDLNEVAGGFMACDGCAEACSPGCQPGKLSGTDLT